VAGPGRGLFSAITQENGMRALIILVDANRRALRRVEAMLKREGYRVVASTSFVRAKKLLESKTPDLLITAIRLGAYNGLHLAIGSHFDHPEVPILITHTSEDAVALAEARRYGASFIVAPLSNPRFLPAVKAALLARPDVQTSVRRWFRKPVAGVIEVNAADAPAQIVDMSYGGVRLAFSDPCEIPPTFEIALSPGGAVVNAYRVWAGHLEAEDRFCCGAEVMETAQANWRTFVDSYPAPQ
jgi:CheY-like chemotaxis protein